MKKFERERAKIEPQSFSIFLSLKKPQGMNHLTEAAVMRWLKTRLKDCEIGEIGFGDVVERG